MSEAFTARVVHAPSAPARIDLLGDKLERPEPAQHIITFPGGALELSRIDGGELYWAHIIINRAWASREQSGLYRNLGEVVGSRIDWDGRGPAPIPAVCDHATLTQIAVLVRAVPLPAGGTVHGR